MAGGVLIPLEKKTLGIVLLAASGILWGFSGFFVTLLSGSGLGPMAVVFLRYAAATVLFLPLLAIVSAREGRSLLAVDPKVIAFCAPVGLVSNLLGGIFSNLAIPRIGMTMTTVLLYTAPVFGCVLARVFLSERMNARKFAAIALNFCGVALVVTGGAAAGIGSLDLHGLLAGLAYGLCFASMAILSRLVAGKAHLLTIVFFEVALVAAMSFPLAVAEGTIDLLLSPRVLALGFLYAGIGSVLANIIYQKGIMQGVEISRVSVITSVEVVVATLLGVVALREAIVTSQVGGIALVLLSIAVMNLNAPASEVHGVRMLPYAHELRQAFAATGGLGSAARSVRERRDEGLHLPLADRNGGER